MADGRPGQGQRLCPSCGTWVDASDLICYNCGADLRTDTRDDPAVSILQAAEERLAKNPKDFDALFAKGAAQARMEQWDESIATLNEVTKGDPAYPGVWLLKAAVYARLNKPKMAQMCRERGLELAGVDARAAPSIAAPPVTAPPTPTPPLDVEEKAVPLSLPRRTRAERSEDSRRGFTNGLGKTAAASDRTRSGGLTNGVGARNGLVNGQTIDPTNRLVGGVSKVRATIKDGVTNGSGFTNGLGGARFSSDSRMQRWRLFLIPLAMTVLLVAPLLGPAESPVAYPIVIDGIFSDWAAVSLIEAPADPQLDPGVDIVRFGIADNLDSLAFYAEVSGPVFQGGGTAPGTMDAIRFFVDGDASPATGYRIEGLGADWSVEVFGFGGTVRGGYIREFDPGRDPKDWNGWIRPSSVSAAASGSRVEVAASWLDLDAQAANLTVAVHSQSWAGQADEGRAIAGLDRGTLVLVQESDVALVLSGANTPLLNISATAIREAISWQALTVRILGTAAPTAATTMRLVDATGAVVSTTTPSVRDVTFSFSPIQVPVATTLRYTVVGDFIGGGGETFGARIPGTEAISSDGVAALRETCCKPSVGYVGGLPAGPRVDGGFAEWGNASLDPANDGGMRGHAEIDLRGHGALADGASLHLYADVAGRMFLGTAVPEPAPSTPVGGSGIADADRDTVPDGADLFPFDFDNDNLPDAQTGGDVDGDGVTDFGFGGGTDLWLNGTIPSSFPPPYAGRTVSVYIGPTNRPVVVGDDVLRFLLDTDGNSTTGYGIAALGADSMVEVRGKGGVVTQSALEGFVGSSPGDWRWNPLSPVTVATGDRAVELAVPIPSATAYVEIGDFWGGVDSTASQAALAFGIGSPRPLDIPGNDIYRLRNTNHAETACTINKVASMGAASGPAQLATLSAGQSVCWYLDATSGAPITTGDWESLLDVNRTTALTFDAASSTAGNANSISWSHTTVSQTDGLVVVGVSLFQEPPTSVTAITYANLPLTKIRHDIILNPSEDARSELWYRIGTLSGARTVQVNLSGSQKVVAGAISFTGADQTAPIRNDAGNDGTTDIATVTLASAVGDIVVDTVAVQREVTLTAGAGQAPRWNLASGNGAQQVTGGGSTEAGAPLVTMSWSITSMGDDDWAISAVSIKPAIPDYDVFLEIWNKATDTVDESIGSCVNVVTYADDVQCLISGVGSKSLSSDQVVRLRVRHSATSGTVSIEYDDADTTGNSRVTIPIAIPEFPEVVLPLVFGALFVALVRWRRRCVRTRPE